MRAYMDTLHLELAQWHDKLGKVPVTSIFFGGGTPSLLPLKVIKTTLDKIRRAFDVTPDAEITLEANPESLTGRPQIREYMRYGINRLSMGVQSLDDGHLAMLGRVHTARQAVQTYRMVREAGFPNISLDLMWGLPTQRVRHWLDTLGQLADLRPEHISAYGLTLESGTALAAECDNGELVLPPERDQALMYTQGADVLEEKGFVQYEVSNFSRIGYHCKHNMGYWEGEDYLGLGPSATSTINGRRWTNPCGLGDWGRAVTGKYIAEDAEVLDTRNRVVELIMLRLRTTRGLRLKAYEELTGRDFMTDHKSVVQALHRNKLVRIMHGYMRLTRGGMLVSSSILAHLFAATRHVAFVEAQQVALPASGENAQGLATGTRPPVKIFGGKKRLSEQVT